MPGSRTRSTAVATAAAMISAASSATAGPRLRADRPQLALGADLGLNAYGAAAIAGDLGAGPAWQVRAGAQLHPVFGIDARYFGARHELVGALLAQGFSFEPRVSLPLRARPYLSSGFGWYTVTTYDAGGAAVAQGPLAVQLPVSAGIEWLADSRVGLQAEATYRILFDEGDVAHARFARTQLWGATLGARAYF